MKKLEKNYFAAIVLAEFDSPIDALVSLCVPADEALNLVSASWQNDASGCLANTLDGGRRVAAIRTPENRWAACYAFPDSPCVTYAEAEHRLKKRLKKGRRGIIGML
ncbi:MAG: hypothetical protein LBD67_07840 [Candidatus Accumulibacter sp.]|nr:hypothetical protein [Accumulibacter sp.]